MALFKNEKTLIKQTFSDKYKLIITSEINVGTMNIKTKALVRWFVNIKSINENNIHLELLTLENELIESNSPIVKEASSASQAFARMFSELDVIIDPSFKVLQVLNIDTIKSKWHILKKELEDLKAEDPQGMLNLTIQTNENILSDTNNIINSLQYNEFFQFWAHHFYNTKINSFTNKYSSKTLFSTAIVDWSYNYMKQQADSGNPNHYKLLIDANLETNTNKSWAKEAYKDFTHLDFDSFNPKLTEEGFYTIDNNTGKVINGLLIKKEIVSPELLNATMSYEISIEDNYSVSDINKKSNYNPSSTTFSSLVDE